MENIRISSDLSSVARIQIEYTDGSSDAMNLIQEGDLPLFSLDRKKAGKESISLGAHTGGAIAALLYITLATNQRTDYSVTDKRVLALARSWNECVKKSYN